MTVYRLVNAGSIEERIVEMHRDKRALADGLLDASILARLEQTWAGRTDAQRSAA